MPKLRDVCHHIRSKNAGPYWITLDLFFADQASFQRYAEADAISPQAVAVRYGVSTGQVRKFLIPHLAVVKLSFPRRVPQGGPVERDMHGGQQYVRLLDVEL